MKVYGASVSYYTGKLEAYLRYKGIAYERYSPYGREEEIRREVGCIQHPVVQNDDGRWMTDTTPMILYLEHRHPERCILPEDPVVAFIARLIEDYADEWLWRAAMHYRWSHDHDRELLCRILADELTTHIPLPRFLRCRMVKRRQYRGFVLGDGVTASTAAHVEAGYHRALAAMSCALQARPFLLGDRPSLADIGLMGPMLRHFGQDPTPAEIMRDDAPRVFEWVARTWNAGDRVTGGDFVAAVPAELAPMLEEICATHLVQLAENARAWRARDDKFSMTVQGCDYVNLPVSRYRVHCLEMLREHVASLDAPARTTLRELLPHPGAAVLWQDERQDEGQDEWLDEARADSGYDPDKKAPFNRAINVFEGGVPG